MLKQSTSRRQFLKSLAITSGALAFPTIVPSSIFGQNRPSNRITFGVVGLGFGWPNFLMLDDTKILAVCDVRKKRRLDGKRRVDSHYGSSDCLAYNDFRELLARPDIDAVYIATPDHWHALIAIAACISGKDVYCQKPESLTVREGRAMVNAARRYGRVFSGGSQRVYGDFLPLAKQVWSGKSGKIVEAHVGCGGPSTECYLPAAPMREEIDWDMWLGPAPWAPYHPNRCGVATVRGETGWRNWRDYSGGGMTDWGAHLFGAVMFICDVRGEGPVEVIAPDGKDRKYVSFRFANGLVIHHGGGGVTVRGNPREPIAPRPMPDYRGEPSIYADFIRCVRTRERPFRDIEFAHRTATVCHLGNIAYELGRSFKWDPVNEVIIGDEVANRYLDRAKREPWQLA